MYAVDERRRPCGAPARSSSSPQLEEQDAAAEHRLALPQPGERFPLGGGRGDVGAVERRDARSRGRRRPPRRSRARRPRHASPSWRPPGTRRRAQPRGGRRGHAARRAARAASSDRGERGPGAARPGTRRPRGSGGRARPARSGLAASVVARAHLDEPPAAQRAPGASAVQCASGSAGSARPKVGAGCTGNERVELRRRRRGGSGRARTARARTRRDERLERRRRRHRLGRRAELRLGLGRRRRSSTAAASDGERRGQVALVRGLPVVAGSRDRHPLAGVEDGRRDAAVDEQAVDAVHSEPQPVLARRRVARPRT